MRDGLAACAVCEKLFRREVLTAVATGELVLRWRDARPRTCAPGQAGRGVASARLGAWPIWKKGGYEEVRLVCPAHGGRPEPTPEPPLWKRAGEAWATWKTEPGGGEWGRLAPRRFRG